MRTGVNTPLVNARLDRSVTIAKLFTVSAASQYLRVEAFNNTGGNLIVQGNIFGQVIAK